MTCAKIYFQTKHLLLIVFKKKKLVVKSGIKFILKDDEILIIKNQI